MIFIAPINYEIPLGYCLPLIVIFAIVVLVIVIAKIKIFIDEIKDEKNDDK